MNIEFTHFHWATKILIAQVIALFVIGSIFYFTPAAEKKRLSTFKVPVSIPKHLSTFDKESSKLFLRYLSGNPYWEVREIDGHIHATRRDLIDGDAEKLKGQDGQLISSQMGWYSYSNNGKLVRQSLVRISFGKEFGFGEFFEPGVTRTSVGDPYAELWTIEQDYKPISQYSSRLIAQGNHFNIEISERTPDQERTFTEKILHQIDEELSAVLRYSDDIRTKGRVPNSNLYPHQPSAEANFSIGGRKKSVGIFELTAQLKLKSEGIVETRVFDVKTNRQLSKDTLVPLSRRHVGWSVDGDTFFEYNTYFTVYEGNWDTKYLARFEIWHVTPLGEFKITEKEQKIVGWQR